MANHASHGALPFPVKGARFTIELAFYNADGDPADPGSPDTEISKDNGAYADATEEVSVASGARGGGMITLTGAEMDASLVKGWVGGSGVKPSTFMVAPRVLPVFESGTAQAGAAGSITLAAGAASHSLVGCIVKTTGGTGGGGTGGSNNQARLITAYNTSTKVASVSPNWETNPDNTTTYEILINEMAGIALAANLTHINGAAASAAEEINANIKKISDDAAAADNLETMLDGTGGQNFSTANLATAANQTTILNRLGAFTGSGLNTVLGFLRALMRKDASQTPSDVGGTFDNTTDSAEAIRDYVASAADVAAIQNNTRVTIAHPDKIEVPTSGTQAYKVRLCLYDEVGNMEAPDSAPTIALVNQAGTDRSSRLSSTTMSSLATGEYEVTYTADAAHAQEQLLWTFTVVEGSQTRKYHRQSVILDAVPPTQGRGWAE